jgi:small subunit ribosomal protein S16
LAVKIRLMRVGKKKQPTYRVVVADSRSPRDGRFIEIIGQYAPRAEPSVVSIDSARALHWLNNGAVPTESASKLLEISGVYQEFQSAHGGKAPAAKPKPKTPKAKTVKEQPKAEAPAEAPVEEAETTEPDATGEPEAEAAEES